MKLTMRLLLALAAFVVVTESFALNEDYQEPKYEPRFMGALNTFNRATEWFNNFRNMSIKQSIQNGAGAVTDVALATMLGPWAAVFVKQGLGLAGEALSAGSDALKNHPVSNNAWAKKAIERADVIGDLLSAYGGGSKKVQGAIDLADKVKKGEMTITKALTTAGVKFTDDSMENAKQSLAGAGKALEAVGGIVNRIGDTLNAYGKTSAGGTVESVDNFLSKFGADKVMDATANTINKVLKINIQEAINNKVAEIDKSSASSKEKARAIGQVIDRLGKTLDFIADTAEDLGNKSVVDYPAIIKDAIDSITVNKA